MDIFGGRFIDSDIILLEKLILRGYSKEDIVFLDVNPSEVVVSSDKEVVVVNTLAGDLVTFANNLFTSGTSKVCIFREKSLMVTFVNLHGVAKETPIIPPKCGSYGRLYEMVESMKCSVGFGSGQYELARCAEQFVREPSVDNSFSLLQNSDFTNPEKATILAEFCRNRYEAYRTNEPSILYELTKDKAMEELPLISRYLDGKKDVAVISPSTITMLEDLGRAHPHVKIKSYNTNASTFVLYDRYTQWTDLEITSYCCPINRAYHCFSNDLVLMLDSELNPEKRMNQFFAAFRSLRKNGLMIAEMNSEILMDADYRDFRRNLWRLNGLVGIVWRRSTLPDQSALLVLSPTNPHPGKVAVNIIDNSNCDILNEKRLNMEMILDEILQPENTPRLYTLLCDYGRDTEELTVESLCEMSDMYFPASVLGNAVFGKDDTEIYGTSESGIPCIVKDKCDAAIGKLPHAGYTSGTLLNDAYVVFCETHGRTMIRYLDGRYVLGPYTFAVPVDKESVFVNGTIGELTPYGLWFFFCCECVISSEVDKSKFGSTDLKELWANIQIPAFDINCTRYYSSRLDGIGKGYVINGTCGCRSISCPRNHSKFTRRSHQDEFEESLDEQIAGLWSSLLDPIDSATTDNNRAKLEKLESLKDAYWALYYQMNNFLVRNESMVSPEERKFADSRLSELENEILSLYSNVDVFDKDTN